MTDAEKQMLATLLHFGADTTLSQLSDDLVAKIPGPSGLIAKLVWSNAKPQILAILDKEIDSAIAAPAKAA